jgi:glucose uptake protein GlcU
MSKSINGKKTEYNFSDFTIIIAIITHIYSFARKP